MTFSCVRPFCSAALSWPREKFDLRPFVSRVKMCHYLRHQVHSYGSMMQFQDLSVDFWFLMKSLRVIIVIVVAFVITSLAVILYNEHVPSLPSIFNHYFQTTSKLQKAAVIKIEAEFCVNRLKHRLMLFQNASKPLRNRCHLEKSAKMFPRRGGKLHQYEKSTRMMHCELHANRMHLQCMPSSHTRTSFWDFNRFSLEAIKLQ